MLRAVLYLRVSLDKTGRMLAVERQREDGLKLIHDRGWKLVNEYVDNSISASKRTVQRPAYDRMVADYELGAFDAIVVWDLDRLTRQPRQLEDWIDRAQDHGLKLVTVNGEADLDTDAGRLFARIKAAVAREEVERKGARQRRAALQRVQNGTGNGFKPCYGYTSTNQIVEPEAEVVRTIYSRFATGETLYSIRKWLNTSGNRPHQAAQWSYSSLRGILTNPRYAARIIYKGVVQATPGTWQPIIDDDLFDAVQAILRDPRRKTNRVGIERRHLLSGIARCGVCGGPMRGNRYAYTCVGHVTKAQKQTDAIVLAAVSRRLNGLHRPTPPQHQDPALRDRIRKLRGRVARVEREYDEGLIDGHRYKAAHDRALAELEQIEQNLVVSASSAAAARILDADDPVAALAEAPLSVVRATIDALCEVKLLKRPEYSHGVFDPKTVLIAWRD